MLLNEVIHEVKMTKRAVKYYEEKGLLTVSKDCNGYRNYTDKDIDTLKKISIYRKLGISIKDIQNLLKNNDNSILLRIYEEKLQNKAIQDAELEALKQFIDNGDVNTANELLEYPTIESTFESLLPGKAWFSNYLKNHFKPFLNVRIETQEQKEALHNILTYCDETTLKVPYIMELGIKLAGGIRQNKTAEEMISYYRDMSEDEYQRLKESVRKGAKMKNGILKYHPSYIAQRKMMKEFQNKGYNDIFISNMMILSPKYREYKNALDKMNDRICRELGLYYDSNYNLVIKNHE